MTGPAVWPDTTGELPPADHPYASATWLLGRHPYLGRLAARISGVVEIDDDGPSLDLVHLARVIVAVPVYEQAWRAYTACNREPDDEVAWGRWRDAGPEPDSIVAGLSDFLAMSSGEVASLRLLATFASERTLFRVDDLVSLDERGQLLLTDWTVAVRAAYATMYRPAGNVQLLEIESTTHEGRLL